jgi:preprotein translocase subunit SecA
MAGRGTDIVLGGNLESEMHGIDPSDEVGRQRAKEEWQKRHDTVLAAGGLHIVGTERHESRRIDNQLRGRSGRQGDPGSSRFYLSLEDNLMRIFGDPERTKRWLQTAGMKEGEVIESRMLSKQIERAQRKVEAHNFDARKNLLEYDDVANDQRKVIYQQRTELMAAEDVADAVAGIRTEVVNNIVDRHMPQGSPEEMWNVDALVDTLQRDFGVPLDVKGWLATDKNLTDQDIRERVLKTLEESYAMKEQTYGAPIVRHLEKHIMLQQLDSHWREHLAAMDYLRQGIHLRSYAQKNPKQEYKREAFELFSSMLDRIKHDTVSLLSRMQLRTQAEIDAEEAERQQRLERAMRFQHAAPEQLTAPAPTESPPAAEDPQVAQFVRDARKVGRNEACPCGSGKKYKHCHGALVKEG